MRKSKSAKRARLAVRAGLTTGVVGAALLAAPQAALAVITVPTQVVAPGSTGLQIVDTNSSPFTNSTGKLQLLTGFSQCNAKYATPSSAIIAVTPSAITTSTATFDLPAGVTAGPNGTVKRWIACEYDGTTVGTSNLQGLSTGYGFWVGSPAQANPAIGPSGGGNIVNIASGPGGPLFAGYATIGTVFTTGECGPAYGTPTAGTFATATKVSDSVAAVNVPSGVTNTSVGPTNYSICVYGGNSSGSALLTYQTYQASQISLNQYTGPYNGGNGLNVTSPLEFLAGVDTPGALFTTGSCPAQYTQTAATYVANTTAGVAPVPVANARKLSNTRLAVTAPQFYATRTAFTTAFSSGTAVWTLCIYNGQEVGTSTPIYSTPYSITTVASATKVTPSAGPALGNRKITVSGVALPLTPGALTATLGGTPLMDINVINSGAFTATTPMHAPANNVALVLTTSAGSSTLSNAYSFTSSLTAVPNTAPNTRPVDIIVNGVGFQSPAWNTGQSGAHIYLVKGTYESSESSSVRANPGEAECLNVLPLSDTELVCTLALDRRLTAAGTAAFQTPNDRTTGTITTVLGSRVITVAVVALSKLDVGLSITSANLPTGTTIVEVLDSTRAVVSNFPTAAASGTASVIGAQVLRTGIAIGGQADAGTTITTATGNITAADIGRRIIGADITANSRITDVSVSGNTATVTLSPGLIATVSGATSTASIAAGYLPVPEGAYNLTYVSNGANGAANSDPDYVQSIISSASTFTVSSF